VIGQRRQRGWHGLAFGVLPIVGLAIAGCHYGGYTPTEPTLPVYTIQQLGLLVGGSQSEASAGAASGIVGWASDAVGHRHAVTFAGGSAARLAEPVGAVTSEAHGINASGTIVGLATMSGGAQAAILWPAPTAAVLMLPTLGGAYAVATGINDEGTVVGAAQTDTGDTVLVVWQPTSGNAYQIARVDSGGGVDDLPVAINNSGELAGNLINQSVAFLWNASDGFDTVSASAQTTYATGLSNYGIEVGRITNGANLSHAYVYTTQVGLVVMGGPPAGYTQVEATAVTDQGIIAGRAWTVSGSATATSEAVLGSVVNPAAAFSALPSLGGALAQPVNNARTPCGTILGWATASSSADTVAVAWVPKGCSAS
jgi:probable HAF family extracellular repeat protein